MSVGEGGQHSLMGLDRGKRTSVGDDVGRVAIPRETFCVVHHARTPPDVAEDDERDRFRDEGRAGTLDAAEKDEQRDAACERRQQCLDAPHRSKQALERVRVSGRVQLRLFLISQTHQTRQCELQGLFRLLGHLFGVSH